jgi:electron transfer flavoprotein alpha subunit
MPHKLGAAVDSEFVSNELQVGQTGKVIASIAHIF